MPLINESTNEKNNAGLNENNSSNSRVALKDSKVATFPTYCVILTMVAVIGGLENGINIAVTNIPGKNNK